jgi:predicted glycosyltransferase
LPKVKNGHYVSRRLNIPPAQVLALRSELLLTSIESYRPSVVLVDKHPFGVCGEFRAALESARNLGARTALGLRDILDEPSAVCREWAEQREEIPALFDLILVYGERAVFDPIAEYKFGAELSMRTRFCGYVLNEEGITRPPESLNGAHTGPLVVGTAGGGEDGFALLENVLRAAVGATWRAFIVAGPMMPRAQFSALETLAARSNAALYRFVPNVHHLFRFTKALVCMGGYNTLVEAVATGVPTICVPRIAPRREQALRANAFEKLGLLRTLPPDKLTPELLRKAIEAALGDGHEKVSATGRTVLQLGGALQAARHLYDLAQTREGAGAQNKSIVA